MKVHVNVHDINPGELEDWELTVLRARVEEEVARRSQVSIELTLEERCLLECGHTIPAIKSVRERIQPRPSLRQAKDACDAWRNANMKTDESGKWTRK